MRLDDDDRKFVPTLNPDKLCNIALVILVYFLLAGLACVGAIVWRLV